MNRFALRDSRGRFYCGRDRYSRRHTFGPKEKAKLYMTAGAAKGQIGFIRNDLTSPRWLNGSQMERAPKLVVVTLKLRVV